MTRIKYNFVNVHLFSRFDTAEVLVVISMANLKLKIFDSQFRQSYAAATNFIHENELMIANQYLRIISKKLSTRQP